MSEISDTEAKEFTAPKPTVKGKPEDLFKKFREKFDGKKEETPTEEKTETKVEEITQEKKPSFTRQKIMETKTLSHEKEELQKKIEEYEKVKPELETKIADLEKKLEESTSKAQSINIEEQIEKLNKEKEEQVGLLLKEKEELQKRVSFYDLTQDPDFEKEYVAPMSELYGLLKRSVLVGEPALAIDLDKALNANVAALQAPSEADRVQQEQIRDEILSTIHDQLPSMKQARFNTAVNDLLIRSEKHADALRNHELTARQVKENRERTFQEQSLKNKNLWKGYYKEAEAIDYSIPEEITSVIKSNKLDADVSADDKLAQAIVEDGGSRYSPQEVTRLVRQGKEYKKLVAVTEAYKLREKELLETISKLKGSSTSSQTEPPSKAKSDKPSNLTEYMARFRARTA